MLLVDSCCRRRDWIGQDSGGPELGGDAPGQMAVLPLHVTADRVVAGEGPRAVGARDTDALVALPNVRPQICLVAVGPLAKRAPQFCTY